MTSRHVRSREVKGAEVRENMHMNANVNLDLVSFGGTGHVFIPSPSLVLIP